ncbi:hypothetical protein [Chelatococcus asaccharovorans]|uniref:hypothetical protein n=1 Tax=Chelatococcus asaccharovorans TaxID=28210 RepID=UPI00224C7A22|nr:hypothetical protein [Chelatococcus asaccharovorans]CAH1662304.1 conserved hypothetical protein [Chelatococcus asaccharovorans]CAH1683211.1 conserved hypothetical protein [Chelatococcus asaccharovorans]
MDDKEPPSSNSRSGLIFLVGQNRHGEWVVRNQSGSKGGLFTSREHAMKFALSECGKRPQAIALVAGIIELSLTTASPGVEGHADPTMLHRMRRAA